MADRAPFLIRLEDGTTCRCAADERLLEALRRQGLGTVAIGCRRGGCGVCRVRILEGDYVVGPMSRAYVSEEAEAEGDVLACCVYPRSNLTVEMVRTARPVPVFDRACAAAAATSR